MPGRGPIRAIAVLSLALLASACASAPEFEPSAKASGGKTASVAAKASPVAGKPIGRPYTVRGQSYQVRYEPNYNRVGMASWYGPGFHGKTTANGEKYDMYGMTAAHKTLPFGTFVKVTNLRNNRTLVVRINDRGPFVKGRIIDLSKKAAERLGFLTAGKAKVRVQVVRQKASAG